MKLPYALRLAFKPVRESKGLRVGAVMLVFGVCGLELTHIVPPSSLHLPQIFKAKQATRDERQAHPLPSAPSWPSRRGYDVPRPSGDSREIWPNAATEIPPANLYPREPQNVTAKLQDPRRTELTSTALHSIRHTAYATGGTF
jgi:hypothetical protein